MAEGFARCLNAGCELYDTDRPIEIVHEVVERKAPDMPVVTQATHHFHPQDDGDIHCPGCGEPCALLPEPRRVIPRYV